MSVQKQTKVKIHMSYVITFDIWASLYYELICVNEVNHCDWSSGSKFKTYPSLLQFFLAGAYDAWTRIDHRNEQCGIAGKGKKWEYHVPNTNQDKWIFLSISKILQVFAWWQKSGSGKVHKKKIFSYVSSSSFFFRSFRVRPRQLPMKRDFSFSLSHPLTPRGLY